MSGDRGDNTSWNREKRAAREARFDESFATVLSDVSPPAGAVQRLLDRLEQESAIAPAIQEPSVVQLQSGKGRRRWKRTAWAFSGFAALAASLLLAAWLSRPSVRWDVEDVLTTGLMEFAAGNDTAAETRLVTYSPPSDRFSLPEDVFVPRDARWRPIEFLGRGGVAYDLTNHRGAKGRLYIVSVKGGPPLPPIAQRPLAVFRSTAGRSTTAWSDGQRLFVLVAQGGARELSGFLRPAAAVT